MLCLVSSLHNQYLTSLASYSKSSVRLSSTLGHCRHVDLHFTNAKLMTAENFFTTVFHNVVTDKTQVNFTCFVNLACLCRTYSPGLS